VEGKVPALSARLAPRVGFADFSDGRLSRLLGSLVGANYFLAAPPTQRERFLLVIEPIIQTPIFTRCSDQQVQAMTVRVLVPSGCAGVLNLFNERVCKCHLPPFVGMRFYRFQIYQQKYHQFVGVSCYSVKWRKTTKNPQS
jgi:hypothetical protein